MYLIKLHNRDYEAAEKSAVGILFVIEAESETPRFDDTTVIEHSAFFTVWDEYWTGSRGQIVMDEGGLYRAIHDILVPEENNIKPSTDKAGQKWRSLGKPGEEWPEWSRPILPDDGYLMGDKVTHNGKRWIVTAVGGDGRNVWEPGVYGWQEVT